MRLETIDVSNVRGLSKTGLTAEPGLNLVYGANGSGKTSLLEAINLLSRAKSFRTKKISDVIRRGEISLQVTANVFTDDKILVASGIERKAKETRIRFNGEQIRQVSKQARNLPMLLLTPESLGLLTDAPKERRRWLDWLMFHVEPEYLQLWSDYQKGLRNRNHLLRGRGANNVEFIPWELKMSALAEQIATLCTGVIERLQACFEMEIDHVLPGDAQISYQRGWNTALSLASVLEQSRKIDIEAGYTRNGPHRADVLFEYAGNDAGGLLSRGQAKLYMAALLLAQARLVQEKTEKKPIILIDDVFAELDNAARDRLSERLASMDVQSFITSTEEDMKNYCSGLFHVKQGEIEKTQHN